MSNATSRPAAPVDGCPLSWPDQRRNLILFAACTSTHYLAAPVVYVGITHASLCDRLGGDARTSNLPLTLFFAMTAMPALLAWLSPRVSALKRNLMLCYLISAVMMAAIAVALWLPIANWIKVTLVILQGGVSGAVMPAAIALLWEAIGRGSADSRRGLAMSLAFGLGPVLAVIASFAQFMLLGGDIFGLHFDGVGYPLGFIVLFGGGAPVMLLAAGMARFFVIPPVERELEREPIRAVAGLLIGLPLMFFSVAFVQVASIPAEDLHRFLGFVKTTAGALALQQQFQYLGYAAMAGATVAFVYHFRTILQQRVLFLATVVTILVYAANTISANMNLYSPEVLGDTPEKYAGLQNMLRFGFKAVTGAVLGWLLTRTNPRAGILATSAIYLASQIWALFVTGPWYLVAFGLFGAGELVGAFAPNYILSASRKNDMRRNMAFVTMLMAPTAPMGYMFGAIADAVKASGWTAFGATPAALGFRLSFLACGCLVLCGIVLALTLLPKQPRPADSPADQ